jgi:hypothetical protein
MKFYIGEHESMRYWCADLPDSVRHRLFQSWAGACSALPVAIDHWLDDCEIVLNVILQNNPAYQAASGAECAAMVRRHERNR